MNDKHGGADPYAQLTSRTTGNRPRTGLYIVAATAAVVIVLGVVAIVMTSGGSEPAAEGTGVDAAQNATQEAGSVTVTGEPLPSYPQVESFAAPADQDPAVGLTPPLLEGQTFDGSDVTIDPGDGTAKLVVFFAHWCPHCQREAPELQNLFDDGKVPEGVEVYAVSTAAAADRPNYPPSDWLASVGWTPQVLLDNADSAAANAYGLTGFPYMVFIDADGKVVQRASGEVPMDQVEQYMADSM